MANEPRIIAPRQPMVDAGTGMVNRDWYRFIFNLQQQSAGTTGTLADTQTDVPTIQGQVTTLQTQMTTAQADITTLEGQVTTLQAQMDDALLLGWLQ